MINLAPSKSLLALGHVCFVLSPLPPYPSCLFLIIPSSSSYQDWFTGTKIVVNARGGKNLDGKYEYPRKRDLLFF